MRNVLHLAGLLVLALSVACGSDDTTTGGSGAVGGSGGDAGSSGGGTGGSFGGSGGTTGGAGGEAGSGGLGGSSGASGFAGEGGSGGTGGQTHTLNITIMDLVQNSPINNMDVCIHDAQPENCTTTNPSGVALLQVPAGENVIVTYGTALSNFRTHALAVGADAIANGTTITTGALLESIASFLFASIGMEDDPSKGHIVGVAYDTPGATALIDPASGEGPIYADASGTPDPLLKETSISGAFLFVNVDPGTVEVQVAHPGLTCAHMLGHEGSGPGATPVFVEGGWFTIASAFVCN